MKRNRRNTYSYDCAPGPDIEGAERHAGYLRLMAAILKQSYFDLCYGDLASQVDAHHFLITDAPIYVDALQLDADPLEPITSGKARLAKREKKKQKRVRDTLDKNSPNCSQGNN